MSVVRGIGYYDGIVFEAFDKGGEEVGAVLGGGRYDRLCGVYGKRSIPATGVAGGVERLLISLEKAGVLPKHKEVGTVFVAAVNDELDSIHSRLQLSFVTLESLQMWMLSASRWQNSLSTQTRWVFPML